MTTINRCLTIARSWIVVAFAICVPLLASAQPPSGDAAAKAHFERGKTLVAATKFDDAYRAFEAAYQASPRPAFLFNMGEAARAIGDVQRARAAYERFLAAEPSGTLADTARRRMAELAAPTRSPAPASGSPPSAATAARSGAATSRSTAAPATSAARSSAPPSPATSTSAARSGVPPSPRTSTQAQPLGSNSNAIAAEQRAPAEATRPQIPSPRDAVASSPTSAQSSALQPLPPPAESRPLWKKWPFWAAVGGGVAAAAIVVVAVSTRDGFSCVPPSCVDASK